MKYSKWMKKFCVIAITGSMLLSCMPLPYYAEPINDEEQTVEKPVIPEDAIYLSTAEDILDLAEKCMDDDWSIGKTIVLKNDIDMTGVSFYGIPTFGGIFLGQGYTIRGIIMEQNGSVVGVFRYTQKTAVIDNVKIEATIQPEGTSKMIGGIVGSNAGTIKNCVFTGTVSGKELIGGIAGLNKAASVIENCTTNGIIFGNHYIGGIAGENKGVIRECTNMAEVNTDVEHNSIGLDMNLDMNSLTSSESLDSATNIGGIAGTSSGVIRECYNKENVGYKKMGYNVGGIVGSQNGYVVDCINYAKVEGSNGVGGIVGQFRPNIVLEFGPDPVETMTNKVDSLKSSVEDLTSSFEEIELGFDGDSLDMEAEMNEIKESLESLENSKDPETGEYDKDVLDSIMNDFSDSLDKIYEESKDLEHTTESSNISSKAETVVSKVEDLIGAMDSMDVGMELKDVSKEDKESDTIGKVANCANYGEIAGENAVAGIAGKCDSEILMSEEDIEIKGDSTVNMDGRIRLVVRGCKNYGTIAANKDYVGGIVGQMAQGAILSCYNIGNLDALAADYVGGIAGNCKTYISDCYSKNIIAGANYVGGIAGRGVEVLNCYAFVNIAAGTEFVGSILGSTDELPSSDDSLVVGNYYYHVGSDRGGIDGVNYKGATGRIVLEDYLHLEKLDDMFKTVTVRFVVEGQEDVVKTVNVGESIALSEIPVLTVDEGDMYDWVVVKDVTSETLGMNEVEEIFYISEARLSNILFNQTYKAEFEAKNMVCPGEEMTADNHPIILAIGAFDKNTSIKLTDMLGQEPVINEWTVKQNWSVSISNIGVEKLHYRIPEGMDTERIVLLVKDSNGKWAEREFMVEGSYIVFEFVDGEAGFALAETTAGNGIGFVIVFVVAVVVAVILTKRRGKHA